MSTVITEKIEGAVPLQTSSRSMPRSFTILLSSIVLLSVGQKIYELVLPLMIYELTRSAVAMTTMRTVELLPNFLFAIIIGVLVDRVNQKRWALWMVGAQAILLTALVFLFKNAVSQLTMYYIIGFLLMTFNYGFFNVQVSLTKRTVSPDRLTQANARISFVETFVTIMGPALSGVIFLISDLSDGILMTAILFMVCTLLLTRLRLDSSDRTDAGSAGSQAILKKNSFLQDIREGWQAFAGNRLLFMMTMFVMLLNCSATVVNISIVFSAKDDYGLSSSALALTLSASGLGGIVGSMLVSRLRTKYGLGKIYALGNLLCGISYALPAVGTAFGVIPLVLSLFMFGLGSTAQAVMLYAFRQEQTPPHLMGRIAGITGTLFRVGMPVVMYISGFIIAQHGTAIIFVTAGVWNACCFLLLLRSRLWRIR
ncbi:MFS transporter [Paenibacillus sambharensis]|nr:MFS transporter [Paenibacillus sambharensis]